MQRWMRAGCFERLVEYTRILLHEFAGGKGQPTAACIDSRTLQSLRLGCSLLQTHARLRTARHYAQRVPLRRLRLPHDRKHVQTTRMNFITASRQNRVRSASPLAIVLLLLFVGCGSSSFAQVLYGSPNGIIPDPTGAAIVGAKVEALEMQKGISQETTTGEGWSITSA